MDGVCPIPMKFKYPIKIVSLALILGLISEPFCFADSEIKSQEFLSFRSVASGLKFPKSVAETGESWSAPNGPTVILIQDAHANPSAQKNLSKTLEIILNKYSKSPIFVEGGFGESSLSFLRTQKNQRDLERFAEKFLKNGVLHGEEYLQLTSDRTFPLWGVEDRALYEQSLKIYRRAASKRQEFKEYLDRALLTARSLKKRIYNPKLSELDEKKEQCARGDLKASAYLESLILCAQDNGVSLLSYPHLQNFEKLIKSEPRLAHRKLRRMDGGKILEEQGLLEQELFEKLAASRDERVLIETDLALCTLKHLLDLSLSARDFKRFCVDTKSHDIRYLTGFLNQKLMEFSLPAENALFLKDDYEAAIQNAEDFYKLTKLRDEKFVENMLSQIEKQRVTAVGVRLENTEGGFRTDNRRQDPLLSVLITGGYHTQNLKELLRKKNISYIVVTPQVLQETNLKRYEKILLGQKLTMIPGLGSAHSMRTLENISNADFMKEAKALPDAARLAKSRDDINYEPSLVTPTTEGVFLFPASAEFEEYPFSVTRLGNEVEVKAPNFALFSERRFPGVKLETNFLNTCTGVAVRALKNGEVSFGLGHIFIDAEGSKNSLREHVEYIVDQLNREGFESKNLQFKVDYLDESYNSVENDERNLRQRFAIEFHRRKAASGEISHRISVQSEGVDTFLDASLKNKTTLAWRNGARLQSQPAERKVNKNGDFSFRDRNIYLRKEFFGTFVRVASNLKVFLGGEWIGTIRRNKNSVKLTPEGRHYAAFHPKTFDQALAEAVEPHKRLAVLRASEALSISEFSKKLGISPKRWEQAESGRAVKVADDIRSAVNQYFKVEYMPIEPPAEPKAKSFPIHVRTRGLSGRFLVEGRSYRLGRYFTDQEVLIYPLDENDLSLGFKVCLQTGNCVAVHEKKGGPKKRNLRFTQWAVLASKYGGMPFEELLEKTTTTGQRIRLYRNILDMSLAESASAVGISKEVFWNLERDLKSIATAEKEKFETFFGKDIFRKTYSQKKSLQRRIRTSQPFNEDGQLILGKQPFEAQAIANWHQVKRAGSLYRNPRNRFKAAELVWDWFPLPNLWLPTEIEVIGQDHRKVALKTITDRDFKILSIGSMADAQYLSQVKQLRPVIWVFGVVKPNGIVTLGYHKQADGSAAGIYRLPHPGRVFEAEFTDVYQKPFFYNLTPNFTRWAQQRMVEKIKRSEYEQKSHLIRERVIPMMLKWIREFKLSEKDAMLGFNQILNSVATSRMKGFAKELDIAFYLVGSAHGLPTGFKHTFLSGRKNEIKLGARLALEPQWVRGSIYADYFLLDELELSKKYKTIAFDLDGTIAVFDPKTKKYILRNGIEELLQQLKAMGYRLVLWTTAARDNDKELDKKNERDDYAAIFFENHPQFKNYFDPVITIENYAFYFSFDETSRTWTLEDENALMRAYPECWRDLKRELYELLKKDQARYPQVFGNSKRVALSVKDPKILGYALLVDNIVQGFKTAPLRRRLLVVKTLTTDNVNSKMIEMDTRSLLRKITRRATLENETFFTILWKNHFFIPRTLGALGSVVFWFIWMHSKSLIKFTRTDAKLIPEKDIAPTGARLSEKRPLLNKESFLVFSNSIGGLFSSKDAAIYFGVTTEEINDSYKKFVNAELRERIKQTKTVLIPILVEDPGALQNIRRRLRTIEELGGFASKNELLPEAVQRDYVGGVNQFFRGLDVDQFFEDLNHNRRKQGRLLLQIVHETELKTRRRLIQFLEKNDGVFSMEEAAAELGITPNGVRRQFKWLKKPKTWEILTHNRAYLGQIPIYPKNIDSIRKKAWDRLLGKLEARGAKSSVKELSQDLGQSENNVRYMIRHIPWRQYNAARARREKPAPAFEIEGMDLNEVSDEAVKKGRVEKGPLLKVSTPLKDFKEAICAQIDSQGKLSVDGRYHIHPHLAGCTVRVEPLKIEETKDGFDVFDLETGLKIGTYDRSVKVSTLTFTPEGKFLTQPQSKQSGSEPRKIASPEIKVVIGGIVTDARLIEKDARALEKKVQQFSRLRFGNETAQVMSISRGGVISVEFDRPSQLPKTYKDFKELAQFGAVYEKRSTTPKLRRETRDEDAAPDDTLSTALAEADPSDHEIFERDEVDGYLRKWLGARLAESATGSEKIRFSGLLEGLGLKNKSKAAWAELLRLLAAATRKRGFPRTLRNIAATASLETGTAMAPSVFGNAMKNHDISKASVGISEKVGSDRPAVDFVSNLITHPDEYNWGKDRIYKDLEGMTLGMTDGNAALIFAPEENFRYTLSVLDSHENAKGWASKITRAEMKNSIFEIEVRFTNENLEQTKIFQVNQLVRREIPGIKNNLGKTISVLEVSDALANQSIETLMTRPKNYHFSEADIKGLKGANFRTPTTSNGQLALQPFDGSHVIAITVIDKKEGYHAQIFHSAIIEGRPYFVISLYRKGLFRVFRVVMLSSEREGKEEYFKPRVVGILEPNKAFFNDLTQTMSAGEKKLVEESYLILQDVRSGHYKKGLEKRQKTIEGIKKKNEQEARRAQEERSRQLKQKEREERIQERELLKRRKIEQRNAEAERKEKIRLAIVTARRQRQAEKKAESDKRKEEAKRNLEERRQRKQEALLRGRREKDEMKKREAAFRRLDIVQDAIRRLKKKKEEMRKKEERALKFLLSPGNQYDERAWADPDEHDPQSLSDDALDTSSDDDGEDPEDTVEGARLGTLTQAEKHFLSDAAKANRLLIQKNGARLALGTPPGIYTLTEKNGVYFAEAFGMKPVVLEDAHSAEHSTGTSVIDMKLLESEASRSIENRLQWVQLPSNRKPLVVSIDVDALDNQSSDFHLSRLILELCQFMNNKEFANVHFRWVGENKKLIQHAIRLMSDLEKKYEEQAGKLKILRQRFGPAPEDAQRVVISCADKNPDPLAVNIPWQKLKDGEVPCIKGMLLLSIYAGWMDLGNLVNETNFRSAYQTLAGTRVSPEILEDILAGRAQKDWMEQYSVKPVLGARLSEEMQLYRLMIRELSKAA